MPIVVSGTMRRCRLILFVLLAVPAALAIAGVATVSAHGHACARYGDVAPSHLNHHQARRAIHCLLNRKRATRGLDRLGTDPRLQRAAQWHNDYMEEHRCFSHQCPGEPALLTRLTEVNYVVGGLTRWAYGENIAWGERALGTPKSIVHGWMGSPAHRRNLLDPRFRDLGVGFSHGVPPSPRGNGATYTIDLGVRLG